MKTRNHSDCLSVSSRIFKELYLFFFSQISLGTKNKEKKIFSYLSGYFLQILRNIIVKYEPFNAIFQQQQFYEPKKKH